MTIMSMFFNSAGRLRSGWRFAVFLAAFLIAGVFVGGAAAAVLYKFPGALTPDSAEFLIANALISFVITLLVSWLCIKFLEGLPFRSLGMWVTGGWLKHFLVGLIVGGATLAFAALIGSVFGGLSFTFDAQVTTNAILETMAASFLVFAMAAAFEEIMFRGYILQTFSRAGLSGFAVFLTAILFASVHNANPGVTLLSWVNTFLAGIWLATAWLKTRDLWLAFGLHLAWNWTQGAMFGVEVSGLTDIVKAPLMKEIDNGPTWVTGGDYGIEGGIACTIAITISVVLIYFVPWIRPSEELLAFSSKENPILSAENG
jgi:uncharacterized protein